MKKRLTGALLGMVAILIGVGAFGLTLASLALAAPDAAEVHPTTLATLDRPFDPAIVRGDAMAQFEGFPLDQLFVYAFAQGAWRQIPFQIDEVTASGVFTAAEDGLLDANDELVLMMQDLGDQVAGGPHIEGQPIGNRWYELEIYDPADSSQKAWAYLLHSALISSTVTTDYVSFNPALHQIQGTTYQMAYGGTHAGFETLELNGSGVDLLDRTKSRYACRFSSVCPLTEETIGAVPDDLVKDGPVRVILRGGKTLAYATKLTWSATRTLPPFITGLRLSTDWSDDAVGSTLYSAAAQRGVVVDGATDSVPPAPLSSWWQLSNSQGTVIQVQDLSELGGSQSNFYLDDSTPDPSDTGDQQHLGEIGTTINRPSSTFTQTNSYYFLPSGQPNVGRRFAAYAARPLAVTATLQQEFVTDDVRIGDLSADYVNIEFSPDMRYASIIELSFPIKAWLAGVNPDTGELIPSDGRGVLVAELYNAGWAAGSPQWGEDSEGPFVVAINKDYKFVMARPTSPTSATITVLPTAPNPARLYPYPAKLPDRETSFVAYLQADLFGEMQAWYIDLADPERQHKVSDGPQGIYPPINASPLELNIHRWFYGEPTFIYGYSDTVSGKVQIMQYDVTRPHRGSVPITDDQYDHMDEFPFPMQGERYLIGGINNEAVGQMYQRPPGSEMYEAIQRFVPYASDLLTPTSAVGFESFEWEGEAYTSFQIRNASNSILARTEAGEVWLSSLFDPSLMRRVSGPELFVRADPEFYLGTSQVWVYYHAKPVGGGSWQLRRATTGLVRGGE